MRENIFCVYLYSTTRHELGEANFGCSCLPFVIFSFNHANNDIIYDVCDLD